MNRLAGQAGEVVSRILAGAGMLVMTLFLVLLLAAGGLAYRLSQGPLQIPWLATRLANAASGEDVEIHIGQAALAWQGYKRGSREPLFLELADITVRNTAGATMATIPQAQLAFSLGALFASRAPVFVSSRNAHVMQSDAPVSLLASIRLGAGFSLASADLWVTLGAGRLGPPGMQEPLAGGKFLLAITPKDVRLSDGVLTLQRFGESAPVLHIAASAHKTAAWQGAITLNGDQVHAQDLYHYWPAQAAIPTRQWVTRNITAGIARQASFTLNLSAPLHLSTVTVDGAHGGFNAAGLTLTWLQGVQPLTQLAGKLALTDADDIDITADTGRLGGIMVTHAQMHIAGVSKKDQFATLQIPISGTVQDGFAVLNGPNLQLLKAVPPPVPSATGEVAGVIKLSLPLETNLQMQDVRLNVATTLTNVTLPLPVQGLTLQQGALAVDATSKNLMVNGQARLSGQPVKLAVKADFGVAKGTDVTLSMTTVATPATIKELGWDTGNFVEGAMPVTVQVSTTPASGSLAVTADLTQATLALPMFGWSKAAGQPGKFNFAAHTNGDRFSGIDRIDNIGATAPGLDVETTMNGNTIELSHAQIGDTQGAGRIVPPAKPHEPWRIELTGNALDLSSVFNPPKQGGQPSPEAAKPAKPESQPSQPPSGFLWSASAHFGHLMLAHAPEPGLTELNFTGDGQGADVFDAHGEAMVDAGQPIELTITPQPGTGPGEHQNLLLQSKDAGTLMRALGRFDDLSGGQLDLTASYGTTLPTEGRMQITDFRLLKAPAFAKFLQAITVLGIPEAASGPGLKFTRLVIPFSLENQVLALKEARAYSASLGFTASGTFDLNASLYNIHGTVVPAYALNTLPGKIPIIGKLFSPEKGGGLFAMRFSMVGPASNPKVQINPLSALTPGFLRGIFGVGSKGESK